jgi:EAL domain-containing protein (putative c-di-GMP-specific phosphodiesterase class I)
LDTSQIEATMPSYEISSAQPTAPLRRQLDIDPRTLAADRRRLQRELELASSDGTLRLQYQPRLALGSGRCQGAEALLSWQHRHRGLVSPRLFLPIAEQSGLINRIGGQSLRDACIEAAAWPRQPGQAPVAISVNIAARQIRDGQLVAQVTDALAESGLAPERLELEMTEPLLQDGSLETLLALSALRDLGVGLALDEFGAGPTSISLLRRLPLTTMKLDRALVRNLPAGREDAAITRALIDAAQAMGLIVVAEGIETEPQRCFLAALGCDLGQGPLFGGAVPGDALVARYLAPPTPEPPAAIASAATADNRARLEAA